MTTVVTRAAKGSRLTWGEVDANFTNLNENKVETINPTSSGTLTHSGDMLLSGSGKRITADFSNVTLANRVMFQTSVLNGDSFVSVVPNGTSTSSTIQVYNNSDPTNSSFATVSSLPAESRYASGIRGTGTYLPMTFYTGGSERMRIDTSGNVLVTNPGGLGYGIGAGGVVTQATSKSTAVTLNKPTGHITMNAAALAAGATVSFVLNNSTIAASDNIFATLTQNNIASIGDYSLRVGVAGAGSVIVALKNETAGSLSQAVVFNFASIKGANA